MTVDDVLAINRASDVQISPDGRHTAFVVASWDRETEIEGLLVYPVGYQTGKKYPLLTYIYGRQEGAKGFNAGWRAFPQVYAGRGYAVFIPGFRGASNSGLKFARMNAKPAGRIDEVDVFESSEKCQDAGADISWRKRRTSSTGPIPEDLPRTETARCHNSAGDLSRPGARPDHPKLPVG